VNHQRRNQRRGGNRTLVTDADRIGRPALHGKDELMIGAVSGFHKLAAAERIIAERRRRAQRWPLPRPTMMVARVLSVSPRAIQYWRRGERRPRPQNLYRLWALCVLLNRVPGPAPFRSSWLRA
jgi:hypothetical protein